MGISSIPFVNELQSIFITLEEKPQFHSLENSPYFFVWVLWVTFSCSFFFDWCVSYHSYGVLTLSLCFFIAWFLFGHSAPKCSLLPWNDLKPLDCLAKNEVLFSSISTNYNHLLVLDCKYFCQVSYLSTCIYDRFEKLWPIYFLRGPITYATLMSPLRGQLHFTIGVSNFFYDKKKLSIYLLYIIEDCVQLEVTINIVDG